MEHFLIFACLSELHLLLASVGLAYDDMKVFYKKTFESAVLFLFLHYTLTGLRILTGIVLLSLLLTIFKFHFFLQFTITLLAIIFAYRSYLSFTHKKDYGTIDSIISIMGFLLIWRG